MSKFTAQHYTAIASVLADSIENITEVHPDVIGLVAENFADMLKADNPRFDRELFLEAAGVEGFWRNLGPKAPTDKVAYTEPADVKSYWDSVGGRGQTLGSRLRKRPA